MKRHSSPPIFQLSAAGNRAPTLTPSGNVQSLTFNLTSLPGATDDMFNYAQNVVVRIDYTITGGGGAVINYDALGKIVDSFRLFSPVLGELYPQPRTRGVDVFWFDSWLGQGFRPSGVGRAQIAAVNTTDYTGSVYFVLPLSFEFLSREHDTGCWLPLLENGLLEVRLAANNVLNADSASAVLKATPFTIAAWIEYLPQPEALIQTPFQFRLYEWTTAGTQIKMQQVGAPNGLKGVQDGARLAALAWYSNTTAAGLGGTFAMNALTRISLPWRRQDSIDCPDAYVRSLFGLMGKRSGYIVGGGAASALHDGGSWPFQMNATPNNTLMDANLAFYPAVMPGWNSNISKFQKVAGDLFVDAGFSATPNGTHRLRSLEFGAFTPDFVKELMARMGRPASAGWIAYPKVDKKQNLASVSANKLWGLPLKVVRAA